MKICLNGCFPVVAAVIFTGSLLDAGPSKAVLYIDFIPLNPSRTRIRATGSLDRSLLPSGTGNAAVGGLTTGTNGNQTFLNLNSSSNLSLRYSDPASVGNVAGFRFRISGPTDPYQGTSTSNFQFNAPPIPVTNFFFQLRPTNGVVALGGQDIWIPNSYESNAAINGFFEINASLAQIGLLNNSVTYTLGGESIVLAVKAPAPLPLLGAAAAFGYSRKLRSRIKNSLKSEVI